MSSKRIPPCGQVEVIHGLPGAGKSYLAVRRIVDAALSERRPVYTNLPVRWRVMRAFLKVRGGESYANLIRPLTEDHLRRFITRQTERQQFREELLLECRAAGRPWRESEADRRWLDRAGPDVTEGPEANWIPALAYVVIDEVHHWFPQQSQAANGKFLQGYLTMIRHHLHQVVVISQNPMQVDLAFRRLCLYYMEVKQMGDEKLFFFIRWKHVGIKAIGFEKVHKDVIDDPRLRASMPPIDSGIVSPRARANRVYFRLYDSFTHIGGKRRLLRTLKEQRVKAGLTEDGKPIEEVEEDQEMIVKVYRWRPALLALAIGLGCGVILASVSGSGPDGDAEPVAVEDAEPEVLPPAGRLGGFVNGGVVVGSSIVKLEGVHDGYLLLYADKLRGRSLWYRDGRVFRWDAGTDAVDLGDAGGVVEALRAAHERGEIRGQPGASVGAVGPRSGESVDGGGGAGL